MTAERSDARPIFGWENKRTSLLENTTAPAAQGATHYLNACLEDVHGVRVGDHFTLPLRYDQACAAFVNTVKIDIVANRSTTVQRVRFSNDQAEIGFCDLNMSPTLNIGDTMTFDVGAVVIAMPPGMHLEMPGLHVIEEEPSLYD